MGVGQNSARIVNVLKCLGQDEAVKCFCGDHVGRSQVSDDRRVGVCWVDVEYITVTDADAISIGVTAVSDFKHPTVDVRSMFLKEEFDVVAVDGSPTVEPPGIAQGRRST